MPPERWRQIEDIFHAALEREPAARPAFVESAGEPFRIVLIGAPQAPGGSGGGPSGG
jgi:hypothetical protein